MTKTHTHSSSGSVRQALEIARDYLIEEANSGAVWGSLGNAKALGAIEDALSGDEPQGVRNEAFRDALEQLAAVARTAVSYVGYANDAKREREAQSWIRKKHEELLTSPLSRPESK